MKAASVSVESASIPKALEAEEPVVLRHQDTRGVVTLTLNRPQAFNALSEVVLAALQRDLDVIAKDESVRVIVLAAEGKAFCAGHDLKEMRKKPSLDYYERLFAQCSQMMLSVQRLPVPVIARVQGIATAAGCQLVAMCDLAVASRTARFAVSGVNLGLFCSAPGVALSRNVLRKAAFEMLVTGEFISAEEAKVRGLINRVAEPEQLDAEIEKDFGLSLGEIFALSGQSAYRRSERRALDGVLERHPCFVLAAGGSIVAEPGTYQELLACCFTVWIKASPEEHMSRVIAQGDFRPMADNKEAMADLERILAARTPLYARADAVVETAGDPEEASFRRLLAILPEGVASAPEAISGYRR